MTFQPTPSASSAATPQGFSAEPWERLPLPVREKMSPAQQDAADALIAGPRKAVFGPFIPLLRSPELMSRIGKVGEYLRFECVLPERLRELAMCLVARAVSNQFEWLMHAPLALKAGVTQVTLDAVAQGRQPQGLPADEAAVVALVQEVMHRHGVCDVTYAEAVSQLGQSAVSGDDAARQAAGEQAVVELVSLVGYFTTVCWVMNVARTPALPMSTSGSSSSSYSTATSTATASPVGLAANGWRDVPPAWASLRAFPL